MTSQATSYGSPNHMTRWTSSAQPGNRSAEQTLVPPRGWRDCHPPTRSRHIGDRLLSARRDAPVDNVNALRVVTAAQSDVTATGLIGWDYSGTLVPNDEIPRTSWLPSLHPSRSTLTPIA